MGNSTNFLNLLEILWFKTSRDFYKQVERSAGLAEGYKKEVWKCRFPWLENAYNEFASWDMILQYFVQHLNHQFEKWDALNGIFHYSLTEKSWWISNVKFGLPCWFSGKESACQWRRLRFVPWVKKITRKRKWQPTVLFSPGKSHGKRRLAG